MPKKDKFSKRAKESSRIEEALSQIPLAPLSTDFAGMSIGGQISDAPQSQTPWLFQDPNTGQMLTNNQAGVHNDMERDYGSAAPLSVNFSALKGSRQSSNHRRSTHAPAYEGFFQPHSANGQHAKYQEQLTINRVYQTLGSVKHGAENRRKSVRFSETDAARTVQPDAHSHAAQSDLEGEWGKQCSPERVEHVISMNNSVGTDARFDHNGGRYPMPAFDSSRAFVAPTVQLPGPGHGAPYQTTANGSGYSTGPPGPDHGQHQQNPYNDDVSWLEPLAHVERAKNDDIETSEESDGMRTPDSDSWSDTTPQTAGKKPKEEAAFDESTQRYPAPTRDCLCQSRLTQLEVTHASMQATMKKHRTRLRKLESVIASMESSSQRYQSGTAQNSTQYNAAKHTDQQTGQSQCDAATGRLKGQPAQSTMASLGPWPPA